MSRIRTPLAVLIVLLGSLLTSACSSITPPAPYPGGPANPVLVQKALAICDGPGCVENRFRELVEKDGTVNPNGVKFISGDAWAVFSLDEDITASADYWNTVESKYGVRNRPIGAWEASIRWDTSTLPAVPTQI